MVSPPSFLKIDMEATDYWTPLWKALYQNGASAKNEEATHRFWLGLSDEQQAQVSETIVRKVAAGEFVWYNPIRAIQENVRKAQIQEPEFLKGDEGGDLVQVLYGGKYKICTRETAEVFGLTIIRKW